MIIDTILDRKCGCDYDVEDMEYMYDEAMIFEFFPLASALDCGNENDIKRELCNYVINNNYPKEICNYINSVRWEIA